MLLPESTPPVESSMGVPVPEAVESFTSQYWAEVVAALIYHLVPVDEERKLSSWPAAPSRVNVPVMVWVPPAGKVIVLAVVHSRSSAVKVLLPVKTRVKLPNTLFTVGYEKPAPVKVLVLPLPSGQVN